MKNITSSPAPILGSRSRTDRSRSRCVSPRIGGGGLLACLLLACLSNGVHAADLSAPPADLPARPLHLPKLETKTLPNGLKIVVVQSRRVPIVTMTLVVSAGSIRDGADQPGLADVVAAEMTAGTDRYTSLQLQEQAERLGGSISANAGYDSATVSASALAPDFPQMLDLMSDVALHPAFPPTELGLYQNLTLQTLSVQRQRPAFLAQEELAKVLYPDHPYGVVAPTPAVLQSLTSETLQNFYHAFYNPRGTVLVIVGDVTARDAFQKAEAALGSWISGPHVRGPDWNAATPLAAARRVYLVDRPGSVQSNLVIGSPAITRNDPDYFALTVANTILGGGTDSRLFSIVREKDGYAYDARSSTDLRAGAGSVTESAQTRTAVTVPALKEMLAQAALLSTQDVTPAELADAKSYLNGTFALRLETQAGIAAQIVMIEAYGLPGDYFMTYRDKINAVTAADVRRAAVKSIRPETASVIVVGDGAQLRTPLAEIGPVQDVRPSP